MKNFKSHKSNEIPLGKVNEKCYVMGISGSGKSSILEAIQYALGKNIDNPEEFFHYSNIKGEDALHYDDVALIELTVKNTGPEYLHAYDEEEEITIILEAFNGKRNKRSIRRSDGTIENITIPDLKEFGDYNDPLIFVDDTKTSIWSMISPRQRYTEVAKFMNIETFENNVNLTKKDFKKAKKTLEKAEEDLNLAIIDFRRIEEKYNRYLEKQEKQKELGHFESEFLKAHAFEKITQFEEIQTLLTEESEKIGETKEKREKLRNQIKSDVSKLETIQNNIQAQRDEKEKLDNERNQLLVEITNYNNELNQVKKEIEQYERKLPVLNDKNELQVQLEKIKKEIEDLSLLIIQFKKEKRQFEEELELRKRDKIPLKQDIIQLQNALDNQNISNDILANTLDITKGFEDWIDLMEISLGSFRRGILVEEKNRLKAQEINRTLNTNALLLYPVRKYARKPHERLRSWEDILYIKNSKIPDETVGDFLNLVMSFTYFAESPIQKENYFNYAPRSTVYCKDGFVYRIYSQRKINLKGLSHFIGKGASERQIKILESQIIERDKVINELGDKVHKLRIEQRIKEYMLKYLDLFLKKDQIAQKEQEKLEIEQKLSELNATLSNPEMRIEALKNEIARNKEVRKEKKQELFETEQNFKQLQNQITKVAEEFKIHLTQLYIQEEFKFKEGGIDENRVLETFKDKDYEFTVINNEIISLIRKEVEMPKKDSISLKHQIQTIKAVLETFKDLPDDIIVQYKEQQSRIKSIQEKKEEFTDNKLKCQDKFKRAVENLENELKRWERTVSKKFQEILIGLKLDGKLNFSRIGEGQYELNIDVSKVEGGKLIPLERSGFSKGQKRRVSIAFQTAILTQSASSFFVWDEFDEGLDNYHRELLAKMILEHLPNKKLIGITPTHPIRGYLETFDLVIELYSDENENSQLHLIKFTDKIKNKEKSLDAF